MFAGCQYKNNYFNERNSLAEKNVQIIYFRWKRERERERERERGYNVGAEINKYEYKTLIFDKYEIDINIQERKYSRSVTKSISKVLEDELVYTIFKTLGRETYLPVFT